jgi:hypothetical protein
MKKARHFSLAFSIFLIQLLVPVASFSQKSILSITPSSAMPGRTLDIVLRGINTTFSEGRSIADFGSGITVKRFIVSNPETGIASIEISPGASTGFRKIKVITGSEIVELDNAFEVFTSGSNFKANLELLPFQSASLSDFDISKPVTQPILFFINLYNDNSPRLIKVYMTFKRENGSQLFDLFTDQLSLGAMQVMRLTNRDLNNFKVGKPEGNLFFKEVTDKGTIPPGEYIYKLTVLDENGVEIGGDQTKTVITNPVNNPELINPGAEFNSPVPEVFSPYPLFQWFGQNDRYDFAIYEWLPGQNQEEVVRNIRVYGEEDIQGNSLLYPLSAEKLIEGKVYAWEVWGKLLTSKGIQRLPGNVFRFRYMGLVKEGGDKVNIAKIVVTPQLVEMNPGMQYKFTCIVYDQENKPVMTVKPVWKIVPAKGSITSEGIFTAGDEPVTMAVVAQAGSIQDYSTVTVKAVKVVPKENTEDWMIQMMLRQLFGLPK